MQVTVHYIDGSTETFEETSRPGGSWHTHCRYEEGFFVIIDAWGNATSLPTSTIKRVETR